MRVLLAIAVAVAAGLAAASCRDDPPPAPPPPPPRALIPPLHDAQVGEWLRVETGVDSEMYRVVAATDYEVTVEITRYKAGEPTSSPTRQTWSRNSFGLPANCVVRQIDPESLVIGGVRYDCWRLSIFSRETGAAQRAYWISDAIPVHGLLEAAVVQKGSVDDLHAAKLVDWGPR
jgi:hypothetical protein